MSTATFERPLYAVPNVPPSTKEVRLPAGTMRRRLPGLRQGAVASPLGHAVGHRSVPPLGRGHRQCRCFVLAVRPGQERRRSVPNGWGRAFRLGGAVHPVDHCCSSPGGQVGRKRPASGGVGRLDPSQGAPWPLREHGDAGRRGPCSSGHPCCRSPPRLSPNTR